MIRAIMMIIMSLTAVFMTRAVTPDSIQSLYIDTRYGLALSFGPGGLITGSASNAPDYTVCKLSDSLWAFRFSIFWNPLKHWGLSLDYGELYSNKQILFPGIEDFGLTSGYEMPGGYYERYGGVNYLTLAPGYRTVIGRVMLSGEVGMGFSFRKYGKHREYFGKAMGSNELRRLDVSLNHNTLFTMAPRVSAWYIFGHHFGFRLTVGLLVQAGSSTLTTTLTDPYCKKELNTLQYKIPAVTAFTAEIGFVYCIGSWIKSKH